MSVSKTLVPLVALAAICTVGLSAMAFYGHDASGRTMLLWRFLFLLVLTWWVYNDRRAQGINFPFEFDAFMFFGWPFVMPYYLYRSRGRRGLVIAACIFGLRIAPDVFARVIQTILSK